MFNVFQNVSKDQIKYVLLWLQTGWQADNVTITNCWVFFYHFWGNFSAINDHHREYRRFKNQDDTCNIFMVCLIKSKNEDHLLNQGNRESNMVMQKFQLRRAKITLFHYRMQMCSWMKRFRCFLLMCDKHCK